MPSPPTDYVPLPNSERNIRAGASLRGPADPNENLTVTVRVRRRPDAPALPDLTKPGQSTLSRAEFADRYGASDNDLDRVVAFGAEHGLRLVERSIPRRIVVLSGTVEQVSRAFAVELARYETEDESYRGREGPIYLPAGLSEVVEGVFGLDNRRMARRAVLRRGQKLAPKPFQVPVVVPLTPPRVAELYGFPADERGRGQAIGLIEFTVDSVTSGYEQADVDAFFGGLGLATPTLVSVGVLGADNSPGENENQDGEVTLDIDVAGSVAPDATIVVYFAPFTEQGWVHVITAAVHDADNAPSALSISWAWVELETLTDLTGTPVLAWSAAAMNAVSETFQEAAALGVTTFAASGDWGSDCQIGDRRAHVEYPASDPWVTSCGGTTVENVADLYFTEGTWASGRFATGGGVSDHFPLPTWQLAAGVPPSVNPVREILAGPGHKTEHIGRGVPDIAGNADPASGYMITLWGDQKGPVGGTSAVAPLYAGLIARINERLPGTAGYLNPWLYMHHALNADDVIRDIDDGATNAVNGAPGYQCGPGWDACTGLGSINGYALLRLLLHRGVQPPVHKVG